MIKNTQSPSWKIFEDNQDYNSTIELMEKKVDAIINEAATEEIWLLGHNHVYTKGMSAQDNELINKSNVPVVNVSRGGKFTYHGPGQKIIYPMLDLNNRGRDLKKYISNLELWIILTLKEIGIEAHQKDGFIGVWVYNKGVEQKIAAIGVRVTKWITSHGIALNVNPNLSYFNGIIPCGIKDLSVTSISALNYKVSNEKLNNILQEQFYNVF